MVLQCIVLSENNILSVKLQIKMFSNRILKVLIGCVVLVPVVICTARINHWWNIWGTVFG